MKIKAYHISQYKFKQFDNDNINVGNRGTVLNGSYFLSDKQEITNFGDVTEDYVYTVLLKPKHLFVFDLDDEGILSTEFQQLYAEQLVGMDNVLSDYIEEQDLSIDKIDCIELSNVDYVRKKTTKEYIVLNDKIIDITKIESPILKKVNQIIKEEINNYLLEIGSRIVKPQIVSTDLSSTMNGNIKIKVEGDVYIIYFYIKDIDLEKDNNYYISLEVAFDLVTGSGNNNLITNKNYPLLLMSNILGTLPLYFNALSKEFERTNTKFRKLFIDYLIIESKSEIKGDKRRLKMYNIFINKYISKFNSTVKVRRQSVTNEGIKTTYQIKPPIDILNIVL